METKNSTGPLTIGTSDACRIAGFSTRSFGQAVLSGGYTEAPKTRQGTDRKFTLVDLLAFCVFADGVRAGMTQAAANNCAIAIRQIMRANPDAEMVLIGELAQADGQRVAAQVFGEERDFDISGMRYGRQPLDALRTIPVSARVERLKVTIAEIAARRAAGDPELRPHRKSRPTLARAS